MQNKRIISIKGMHCASCVLKIEKSLKKVKGVSKANVNLATEKALVEYDQNEVKVEQLEKAIRNAGYEPAVETKETETGKIKFKVIGMHSSHCEGIVKKTVGDLRGIKSVDANFANAETVISYDPNIISKAEIKKAVDKLMYSKLG